MSTWIVPQVLILWVLSAVRSPIVLVITFQGGRSSVLLINPIYTMPVVGWVIALIILTRGGPYGNTVQNNSYWAFQPYFSYN